MTEGRTPIKGEPEPPDVRDGTTAAAKSKKRQTENADEMDVQAYHQPESMNAPEQGDDAPRSAMGEPEPPDGEGGGSV